MNSESLHHGVGLERGVVAGLLVLELGDGLHHVQVLGGTALFVVVLLERRHAGLGAVQGVEPLAGLGAQALQVVHRGIDVTQPADVGLGDLDTAAQRRVQLLDGAVEHVETRRSLVAGAMLKVSPSVALFEMPTAMPSKAMVVLGRKVPAATPAPVSTLVTL